MDSIPPRFSKKTLEFIEKASRQKNPSWLKKNREDYERYLLLPLQHFARNVKSKLISKASAYHFPQKGIGRLKRSVIGEKKHQGPFKNWVSYSAARPRVSRFEHNPNLFFLIQTEDEDGDYVLVAGGLYMPSSKQTRAIREAIAKNATPFEQLFKTRSFSKHFPNGFSREKTSTRPPRGFDPTHPKIDWLKLQAFFVWKPYSIKEFSSANFADQAAEDFSQILKLNELLDFAISGRWSSLSENRLKKSTSKVKWDEIEAPRRQMDF